MAISYTVCETRSQRMSFQSTGDSVAISWHKDFFVDVAGYASINEITPYDVMTATGVPVVNKTIYELNNKIIPFVICREKTAEQHPKRLDRWTVKTKYKATNKTTEGGNAPIAKPTAVTDITPQVVSTLGEINRALYEDKNDQNSGSIKKQIRTPTLNDWQDPAIERIPTLTLKISQYESSVTYAQMLARKFKVNQGQYRNEARYKWLIEQVEGVEVTVALAGGDTNAALMTYTLVYSPFEWGWKDNRALIDTHYYSQEPETLLDKLPFQDELGNAILGLVDQNGDAKPSQTGEPDYIQYELYDHIDFDTFLQV